MKQFETVRQKKRFLKRLTNNSKLRPDPLSDSRGPVLGDQGVSTKEKHCQELLQTGQKLFWVMRRGDIKGLVELLGDKVSLGPDYGMTKGDLAKELRRRQGRVYASLFDTKRFRAIEEQRREGFHSEHQKALPPVELLRSIQDHLVEAKNVDVNVEFLIGAVEPKLAVVGFDWPGRPDLFIVPNSAFMWKSNGWKLTHLFSFTSWGAYAPGVAPGDPGIKSEPACRARIRDG